MGEQPQGDKAKEVDWTKKTKRQAVIMVHGMGEQRPLETLFRLAKFIAPQSYASNSTYRLPKTIDPPNYYSRPTDFSDAFETRYVVIPAVKDVDGKIVKDQMDVYEYHWSYLMQGNKLSDLLATTIRMAWRFPWSVPSGLLGFWCLFWAALITFAAILFQNYENLVAAGKELDALTVVLGALGLGTTPFILKGVTWLFKRAFPAKITSHFVDVVRYLDTSPRSYDVRQKVRKGMATLLQDLTEDEDYERIVVVAHSLGAYIAYDAITYYWTQINQANPQSIPIDAIQAAEDAAQDLIIKQQGIRQNVGSTRSSASQNLDELLEEYRVKQKALWKGVRMSGSPWKVSDFISVGTPMYMANVLMTKNDEDWKDRIKERHIATCPPQHDYRDKPFELRSKPNFSYEHPATDLRVLYHAAPFAPVRWTNMWYPAKVLRLLGDWFAGPLAPLFGPGVKDIELTGDSRWKRWIPAVAHALYFSSRGRMPAKGPDGKTKPTAYDSIMKAIEPDFFRK